jgi:chromosome segregation ATPase
VSQSKQVGQQLDSEIEAVQDRLAELLAQRAAHDNDPEVLRERIAEAESKGEYARAMNLKLRLSKQLSRGNQ